MLKIIYQEKDMTSEDYLESTLLNSNKKQLSFI